MFSNLHDYRISRFFFVHCTKWRNSDFTPLSHTHDPVFLNSPRRSPKPKKLLKDRGVYADLIHAQGAFMVQNLNHAATTTPHRSRLQSYDIHIFMSTGMNVSVERVRTFLYIANSNNSNMHWIMRPRSICLSVSLVFLEWSNPHKKKDAHHVHTCIYYSLITISYKTKRKH